MTLPMICVSVVWLL